MELRETIEVPAPQEEAFDYVADFSTTQEWDPGIRDAERVDTGPIRVGSRFRVLAQVGGRELPMIYEITEHDRPHRVVLEGRSATVDATDTISFTTTRAGTRIDYAADLRLKGILGFIAPLLRSPMRKMGRRAVEGLREALGG